MRISDWSSDVCSSDLAEVPTAPATPIAASALARHLSLNVSATIACVVGAPPDSPIPTPKRAKSIVQKPVASPQSPVITDQKVAALPSTRTRKPRSAYEATGIDAIE